MTSTCETAEIRGLAKRKYSVLATCHFLTVVPNSCFGQFLSHMYLFTIEFKISA